MALSEQQRRALRARLSHRHVKTRDAGGTTLSFIEGWHAIAEANRIFGFDGWNRRTLFPRCLWRETLRGQISCFYTAKVRITVHADGMDIVRDGVGTGFGRAAAAEIAHEIAFKTAETDATKRALATFGHPFGLALYDKEQRHVTRPASALRSDASRSDQPEATRPPVLVLKLDGERERSFENPEDFLAAAVRIVGTLPTLEAVYEFWERQLGALAQARRLTLASGASAGDALIESLKGRARALSGPPLPAAGADPRARGLAAPLGEPAALAFPKDKRHRDKAHLAFVASQPCLICGRRPAQAHHLRFAQPRAMSLKVSDEFTLPLCNLHHDQLHRTGDERAWWARSGIIDPLKIAARLWSASRGFEPPDGLSQDRGEPLVADHRIVDDGQPGEDGQPDDTPANGALSAP